MGGDTGASAMSQVALRQHNLSLAFTTIWERGQSSRAELTRRLGLSKPSATRIVNDLIEAGFVQETGTEPINGRGRPATLLVPRTDGHAFVGIDLRLDHIAIQARDLTGALLIETAGPIQTPSSSADLIETLSTSIREFVASVDRKIEGIGIAVGGRVDEHAERIVASPYTDWRDIRVPDHVREAVSDATIPVRMANLAPCGALANWREASRDTTIQDLVHLQIGVGAGAGWIRRQHPLVVQGIPGGVAHLQLDRNGPTCTCGGRGCLDAMAGFGAFVELAKPAGIPSSEGPRAIPDFCRELTLRADEGNAEAAAVIEEIGARVAQAATAMIMILRPSRFTVGGYLLHLGDRFLDALQRECRPHIPDIDSIFTTTKLGDDASVVGAYLLAVAALAEDPLRLASTTYGSGR